MVGIIDREEWITTQYFKEAGDVIFLLGDFGHELGASHYLKVIHGRKSGQTPRLNFERERAVQEALRELIRAGLVRSAHDCSEGGLAVAIAEACFNPDGSLGAELNLTPAGARRLDALLFNESQSRIIVSCTPENEKSIQTFCAARDLPAHRLGVVDGAELKITAANATLSWSLGQIHGDWWNAIAQAVGDDLVR
jgi:phosphoribosylformylglycinamidine synthase